jgi:peptide deformylase
MLSIRRPIDCVVNYWNEEGEPKLEKLQDMTARIFLHEYDHMNGIDFTQRASRLALNIGMKKRDKILKRLEREGKLKKGEDGLYEVS